MGSRELRAMRSMAWERAKGEMSSMIHTYYGPETEKTYEEFKEKFDKFVTEVEDEGLHE